MRIKIITVFFSVFFTLSLVNAQTQSFSYYSKETLDAIGASVEQQAKIGEIKKNTETRIRAVKRNETLTEEQKKEQYKIIYGEGGKLYNEVLTKEQREKVNEVRKEFEKKAK